MAGIKPYVYKLLEDYKRYRGQEHRNLRFKPFWDAVVITTSDADQGDAFLQQIEDKRDRGELPKGLPIHIVSDPPGPRTGNGGSTLTVLEHLASVYGEDLHWIGTMKIFLIHAGGWSQRLPSTTVLGKIFSVIPYGSPPFQMLDLKLALYWPFVDVISPGIFLVCADDFSVHNLDKGGDLNLCKGAWQIPSHGFSALAHPSALEVGRSHGVFVVDGIEGKRVKYEDREKGKDEDELRKDKYDDKLLEVGCEGGGRRDKVENEDKRNDKEDEHNGEEGEDAKCQQNERGVDFSQLVVIRKCLKVLQKPSVERMRLNDALFRVAPTSDSDTFSVKGSRYDINTESVGVNTFGDGIEVKGDAVYTDSGFYMGIDVIRKLYDLKKDLGDLTCEIDAYGDFLQAVGVRATDDYVHDTSNVSVVCDELVETRRKVFEALVGSDIHVVLLNSSVYTHIGTVKELLWYMCRDEVFRDRLSLGNDVFNLWLDGSVNEENAGSGGNGGDGDGNVSLTTSQRNKQDKRVSNYACVANSIIHRGSRIGDDSYIEFCHFEIALQIAGNSVVSNCEVSRKDYSHGMISDDVDDNDDDDDDDDSHNVDNDNDGDGRDRYSINVPQDTFIHTVPIRCKRQTNIHDQKVVTRKEKSQENDENVNDDVIKYVTIILSTHDDVKKFAPISELGSLPFNDSDIKTFLSQRRMKMDDILPTSINHENVNIPQDQLGEKESISDTEASSKPPLKSNENLFPNFRSTSISKTSLWNLKLFPAFPTMTSSFLDAIRIRQGHIVNVTGRSAADNHMDYYSLEELRTLKDVKTMLKYRRTLYDVIKTS